MVHPHVCGEYVLRTSANRIVSGSSPRVWGILDKSISIRDSAWFIPTCVGNTCYRIMQKVSSMVHPHVCGEYFFNRKRSFRLNGSSPRVWGILTIDIICHVS